MGIIRTDVVGDVRVQNDGSRRGSIEFEFADGEIVERNVRAPDATAWANLLIDLPAEVEAWRNARDAEAASDTDEDIETVDAGDASRKEIALAYLRKAWALNDPYQAYLKFDKFNTYRLARGWSLNQVETELASVGLTPDEWAQYRQAYTYLSDSGRVTAMAAYAPILAQWESRDS